MKTKLTIIMTVLVIVVFVLILTSCSGATTTQAELPVTTPGSLNNNSLTKSNVSPTWITPEVSDIAIAVPQDLIQTNINSHFEVALEKGKAYFMAYVYKGKIQVRADICPPCRSISYSLVKDTLVCDSCGTVFKATDGSGVRGACVNYPKGSVPYETVDGKIIMNKADLTLAYENTWSPGMP